MAVTILATIAVLAVLILVHEWGHYVAARWFDMRVPRFSIGLGPKLVGFRRGETEFRISAFPLGGYVKIAGLKEMAALEGEDPDEGRADPRRTFGAKSPAARAVVLSAGVVMNAVVAVALFALVAAVWGAPVPAEPVVGDVVEEWLPPEARALAGLEPGARITAVGGRAVGDMDQVARAIMRAHAGPLTLEFENRPPLTIDVPAKARSRQLLPLAIEPVIPAEPRVGEVVEGGPAREAGLRPGDLVLAVDGAPVRSWQEVARAAERSPGRPLTLEISRADEGRARVVVTPTAVPFGDRAVGRIGAGAAPDPAAAGERAKMPPLGALRYGVEQCRDLLGLMGQFTVGLVDGRHSARELGGPILIGQLAGAAARSGIPTLLLFTALLSFNLAVINLLPIPALDGGHLLLLGIETVWGRPMPARARLALGRAGVTAVAALMIWALAADMLRITGL